MKDGLIISMLSIVPKNATARFMGWSARIQLPRFMHRLLIRWFVWKYGVNLKECEQGIDDFNSLAAHAFFDHSITSIEGFYKFSIANQLHNPSNLLVSF